MSTIVIFDEAATPQRVIRMTGPSENQGDWAESGRTDFVIDPDLSALASVPMTYWKHVAGAIVEMTAQEKTDLDTALAAANTTAVRADAAASLDGFLGSSVFMRAFADILKDEINTLRALHSLAPRTLAQLKTAILNRINSGGADS